MGRNLIVTTDMVRQDGLVSKPYTMISEFIDNSLSSWIGKLGEDTLNKFLIEITFDYSESGNLKISVIDNCFGMNAENLETSLEFSNLDRKYKTSKLNRYGVGMKVATFWSGDKLEIWTKTINSEQNYVYIDLNELDIKNNKIVEYDVLNKPAQIEFNCKDYKSLFNNHGTHLKISNGKINRYDLLKKANLNSFNRVISFKFNRFISKGANIVVGTINQKGEKDYQLLQKFIPKAENISNWINETITNSKKIEESAKKKSEMSFIKNFKKGVNNFKTKKQKN